MSHRQYRARLTRVRRALAARSKKDGFYFPIDLSLARQIRDNSRRFNKLEHKDFMGLQENEWVFSATSERWEHACEHLEPQIFLVA